MNCASRLIECPHCAASGCRNENCPNLVLASGKCARCGQPVTKAKPLRRVCKTAIAPPPPPPPPPKATGRTAAAIAAAQPFELPPPRPIDTPRTRVVAPATQAAPLAPVSRPATAGASRWSWLAAAGLTALLLLFSGYASQSVFTRPPRTGTGSLDVAAMFLDTAALTASYQGNAAAADNLFKGRRITLSGRVERVGDNYISVQERSVSVHCGFGRETTPGERAILPAAAVTLRGTVAGSAEKGRIDMNACELLAQAE